MEVYFSLGTNLGDRVANMTRALDLLDRMSGVRRTALSGFLETEPWGFESSEKFLNAAVRYDFSENRVYGTEPGDSQEKQILTFSLHLLDICKHIERELGRQGNPQWDNDGKRIYTDRPIDIDILFIGNHRINTPRLVVPHPGIADRDFVLIPLREILSVETASSFPEIFMK